MYEYLIIDTDGEETHVESKEKPTLGEMQKAVGGYIEVVRCLYKDKEKQMIINEEGKLRDLELNEKATEMFWYFLAGMRIDNIVGKAMILKNFELD